MAAPLPLPQGALKQPNGGTKAPVTNDLVLTGGLAIPEQKPRAWCMQIIRQPKGPCRTKNTMA